jgi:hypothetical protein
MNTRFGTRKSVFVNFLYHNVLFIMYLNIICMFWCKFGILDILNNVLVFRRSALKESGN